MSQAEGTPAPAQAAAPNGQSKPKTTPKLAPAPVPQQTPWKAPVIDASTAKANFEAVDAAQHQRRTKNAAAQRARESNRDLAASGAIPASSTASSSNSHTSTASTANSQSSSGSASASSAPKRATTGKEKWVPYTPVIPPTTSSNSRGSGNSDRGSSKRQSGSYRQRRSGGSQHSNGNSERGSNSEKRRSQPAGNGNASQSNSNRSAGHQRNQSRSNGKQSERAGSEQAQEAIEKLNLEGKPNTSANSTNSNASTPNSAPNNTNSANSAPNSASNSANSANSGMRPNRAGHKQGYAPRTQNGPRKPRDARFGKMPPYFAGGMYPPAAAPHPQMGYLPLQTIPVPAGPVPPVFAPAAFATPQDMLMQYLISQVDYYFSVENLVKDTFLRRNMNNEGLVPIAVIADFKRVKSLTTDLALVAEACVQAPNIEVVGSKVRVVGNAQMWVFPEANRLEPGLDNGVESALANPIVPASQQPTSSASSSSPSMTSASTTATAGESHGSTNSEPKFQVDQAVPFVPRGAASSAATATTGPAEKQ